MTELRPQPLGNEAQTPMRLPEAESAEQARPVGSPPAVLERALDELGRYYRHSAAGRLVAGIIHRLNTPLQVLSFQIELLDQKNREEGEILARATAPLAASLAPFHKYRREKLAQVRAEIDRLQAVARTLIFQGIHEESRDKQPINLNQVIEAGLDIYAAHPVFQHRIEKTFRLQPGLPLLQGYYLDVSQSFLNLVDNALEAMEGQDRRELTVATGEEDGRLVLAVGDTGPGIPSEIQPLIFQPFFTTKRGHAGLGLPMVRRLLAPYGAAIRVDSTPGGTWVKVYLPT